MEILKWNPGPLDCDMCFGRKTLKPGTYTFLRDVNKHAIAIKNVPANICIQCGEEYPSPEVQVNLDKMIKVILERDEDPTLTTYDEMLKHI